MWLHIKKDKMKGEGKKLRPIGYGPSTILEKIGDDTFHLDFPAYMQVYLMVNIENLKLYDPPLIMDNKEVGQFLQWTIFHLNTWTGYLKISFLTGELGLHDGETWSTLVLVSKECVQVRPVILKRRK